MDKKLFLYYIGTTRSGAAEGQIVVGGTHFHHDELLLVVEAVNEFAAAERGLGMKIVDSFDRSEVKRPTIHYLHTKQSAEHRQDGSDYYFAIKEIEDGDDKKFPNFKEKMKRKIVPV